MITIAYTHNKILETLLQPKIDLLKRSFCTNWTSWNGLLYKVDFL